MTLVFLYGGPAVGKRTVGGELAKLTGWPLHHDHMVVDLAVALFAFDDPRMIALRHRLHLATLEAAATGGLPGLVFAYCIGGAWDDPFVEEILSRYGSEACFVQLTCDLEENKRRVAGADRAKFKKLTDVAGLLETREAIDFSRQVIHPRHLVLDTTRLSAAAAASRISEAFALPTGGPGVPGGRSNRGQ